MAKKGSKLEVESNHSDQRSSTVQQSQHGRPDAVSRVARSSTTRQSGPEPPESAFD